MAGNMTAREVNFLACHADGLLPQGAGIERLKRIAVIGAFKLAGFPLLAAGRLASFILDAFNRGDGEVPSGLDGLALKVPADAWESMADGRNDYHYHKALIRYPQFYVAGDALRSDAVVEVYDYSTVCLLSACPATFEVLGWIDGMGRGEAPRVRHVCDFLGGPADDKTNPGWGKKLAEIEKGAEAQRRNAIAVSRINASLAIRSALDRVEHHRNAGPEIPIPAAFPRRSPRNTRPS